MTRRALVVGAGIGGLSAGIALRQAGWDIRIVERAASPRELGFGLLVAPNAFAALRELGVADVVRARSFAPVRGEMRRMDGTVFKRGAVPPPEALGGPLLVALRPALHGALLEAVGTDAITLDCEVTAFTADRDRVSVTTSSGEVFEGDVLVGADGAGSVIRRQLHPSEPPPRSSGIVAVRGGVHGLVDRLNGLSAVYYLDRGVEAGVIRASETGIYWMLSLAGRLVPPGMRDPAAVVSHMVPRFEPLFRAVTSATEELRCDELYDRDAIPFWGRGRVTILGDAAHPVLPHTGQGAAQALVDAVALGTALGAHADVEESLREYEKERRARTAALLAQGRRTARVMSTMNPLACYVRELAIRVIPVTPLLKVLATINRKAGTDVTAGR